MPAVDVLVMIALLGLAAPPGPATAVQPVAPEVAAGKENAAPRYLAAVAFLDEPGNCAAIMNGPVWNAALPNSTVEEIDAARDCVAQHADHIAALIEASTPEWCAFDYDPALPIGSDLPPMGNLRNAVMLLIANANIALAGAVRMSAHMQGYPMPIAAVIGQRTFQAAAAVTMHALRDGLLGPSHAATIARAVNRFGAEDPFGTAMALRTERDHYVQWLSVPVEGHEGIQPLMRIHAMADEEPPKSGYGSFPLEPEQAERLLKQLRDAYDIAIDATLRGDVQAADQLDQQREKRVFGHGASILMPIVSRIVESDVQARADLDALRAALDEAQRANSP
jgi:hypothetical protein